MIKDLKGKRITLVGGAGFIGHNLALYLKEHGAEVSVIDGLSVNNLLYLHHTAEEIPGDRELYISISNERMKLLRRAGIPVYIEDARNYHILSLTITKINPQILIHLAAVSHANRSNKNPYDTFDNSLRTLENALDSVRNYIEQFVFFSSSMVYGNFPPEGASEETPCNPMGIYGHLKLAGEQMVKAYHGVFKLPYTIVRPSALYGERCVSRRVGQIFIESAVKGQDITLTGNGTDKLDFTYIRDLCHGIKCVVENKNAINQTFNLTYGEGRTIGDMAELIQKNFKGIKIKYEPKDVLTPDRGTLIIDKARKMIGYEPRYPLEKGYREYIQWYKEFYKANFSS
jgi:nucleoside-diphosphate-sugar epimerase